MLRGTDDRGVLDQLLGSDVDIRHGRASSEGELSTVTHGAEPG